MKNAFKIFAVLAVIASLSGCIFPGDYHHDRGGYHGGYYHNGPGRYYY
ncbi:hypothetical protein ITX54_10510 [Rouxiella silvae]|uniref:Lipoprotein n=1 Tax=Rouxiella silvae TaxID=1646373 RepID=A0AA40X2P9_9GAMM|nr:hypothetical protein [Rouxiella silvae]MBF6637082.1 hypothetical protein [Rouxiella silvae]